QTNPKTVSTPSNGFFDSKVLSRQHAEVWATPDGRICIKDIKSSNGTFVNGQRLSPENQESEPRELRENDTLELGIDIISEDQKAIVHHKVSARVDYAGPAGPTMNIMEMSFGDIDPSASAAGLYPQHLAQPLHHHMRNRSNSNSSAASAASNRTVTSLAAAAGPAHAMQQQRHMNYWLSPISIEQLAKKVTAEMKEARLHAHQLAETHEHVSSWLANTVAPLCKLGCFSDAPPAPPPSQPLPEKPRIARAQTAERVAQPARALDAIAAPGSVAPSPKAAAANAVRQQSQPRPAPHDSSSDGTPSLVAQLQTQLDSAIKDLGIHRTRVRELEELCAREKSARLTAEEKIRTLEAAAEAAMALCSMSPPASDRQADELESSAAAGPQVPADATPAAPVASPHAEPSEDGPGAGNDDDEQFNLQARFNALLVEMEEMKARMVKYQKAAQTAEADAAQSRKTLAEMVEAARRKQEREERKEQQERAISSIADQQAQAEHSAAASKAVESTESQEREMATMDGTSAARVAEPAATEPRSLAPSGPSGPRQDAGAAGHDVSAVGANPSALAASPTKKPRSQEQPPPPHPRYQHQRKRSRRNILRTEETGPYMSMMGVVLIGVGIMAYLNGWTRVEK
ncbi:hypothetical protein KEM52_002452, partial [Ascosphaera acerosa]